MLIDAWLARNKQPSTSTSGPGSSGSLLGPGGIYGENCKQMSVSQSDLPTDLVRVDSNTGALTWTILPQRPDSGYVIRLRSILVQTSTTDIGVVTVIPYIQQNSNQAAPLNASTGQANALINAVSSDYNTNTIFVLVTMSPSNTGDSIDSSQITVMVDYCYIARGVNTAPDVSKIPSEHLQNIVNTLLNQQSGMLLRHFLHC